MAIGANGAIKHWQFDASRFFDVSANYQKALNHLADTIAISTQANPLYFIHMGPPEFFYRVVEKVVQAGKTESLNHVYIISHSGYNDTHLRRGDPKYDKNPVADNQKHHTLQQAIALSGNRLKYKRIRDQNGEWDPNLLWNSKHNWQVWQWMKSHEDQTIGWIYERMKRHPDNVADCSDAGMLYYLFTGDEYGSPEKFKQFLGKGVMAKG
ncbi:hypothetical protein C2869_04070 [Saccharobesus litoralis]|uniref:Uncharacterized protein n=1 Tax=Saccharobesus litoralis TaxID=2172099 RepID=A0A2S0VN73_9ALTE|nr:hypothetical protein [Saccharobesus litoralis]AWB65663.1 hypothetical protein C2869_04070 [Saccharobesus litoralis]